MSTAIEIIDPENERRKKRQRKILTLAVVVGLSLLTYPCLKAYSNRWQTLKAASQLSLYLAALKTQAVLKKTTIEARFVWPDLVEVFETSSCGPRATRKKMWDIRLSAFSAGVVFAKKEWVSSNFSDSEVVLDRFCYDTLYGSSVAADGLARGSIVLAHEESIQNNLADYSVFLEVSGASADLRFE
ncbi:MAG: hypothetical protein AB7F43_01410 [Bacteriovoracia bacterium]